MRASTDQPTAAAEADLRTRIVEAATRQFLVNGIATVTMDELAAELGISKRTLYQVFPSKDALLDEVLNRRAARAHQVLEEIVEAPNLGSGEKLRLLMERMGAFLAEVKPPFIHSLKRLAPDRYLWLEQRRREFHQRFYGALLEQARREGVLRPEVDLAYAMELIWSVMQASFDPGLLERLSLSPSESLHRGMTILFRGLLADGGEPLRPPVPSTEV